MLAYQVALFALLLYVVYLHSKIQNMEQLAESHAHDLRILDGRSRLTDECLRERDKHPSWMWDRLNHGESGVPPTE
jgi:hypothetical protein